MVKELHRLFPSTVGLYSNEECKSHKDVKNLLVNLKSTGNLKQSTPDFFQSVSGIHLKNELKDINSFVKQSVFDFIISCGYNVDFEDLYIADSWANTSSNKAVTHTPHSHSNSFISAVYYSSAPKGSGSLYFLHPCSQLHSLDPDHLRQTIDNTTEASFEPKEGDCIVFRSALVHGVSQNYLANLDRISIAYNFNIKHLGKLSASSHYEERIS